MSFAWVSGRPCLDYIGTLRWRQGPEPREYLLSPSDLADWGIDSGLVTEPPRVTAAQLTAAKELREAVYRVIFARVCSSDRAEDSAGPAAKDVSALNTAAQHSPVELSLGADGAVRRVATAAQLLSSVARDALDLLGGDQMALVRECDGATCSRLYVDSSRARNRRWCSNAGCGNQAKVAAFRSRSQRR